MNAAFARLTAGAEPTPETLDVQGGAAHVHRQAVGVALRSTSSASSHSAPPTT